MMREGMGVLRVLAAPHLSANKAHPKIDPLVADRDAFAARVGVIRPYTRGYKVCV